MSATFPRQVRRVNRRFAFVTIAALLIASTTATAKTLYVNGSIGNDSVSYAANGAGTPWRSIARAAWGSTNPSAGVLSEAARAGDTVLVAAGTYATPATNERNIPALNPVNSGSAGNPIVFQATGTVRLTLSGGSGPVIGSNSRNFITWRGFTIDEVSAPSRPDTGPVTVWFCDGCVLENLTIIGSPSEAVRQDNHTGIRFDWSRNGVIRNNRISNILTGHNVHNAAGIMTYDSGSLVIENNEISGSGSGIFLKGNDDPSTLGGHSIRFNRIYNNRGSGFALHINPSDTATVVSHNIVERTPQCVRIWGLVPTSAIAQMRRIRLFNNTFVGCQYGIYEGNNMIAGADHEFRDNISSGSTTAHVYTLSGVETFVSTTQRFLGNVYTPGNQMAIINAEDASAINLPTFAAWRSRFPGYDATGAAVDPLFIDAVGGNYRLRPGSPAQGKGAFVTGTEIIGATAPDLPPAPTNLRVVSMN